LYNYSKIPPRQSPTEWGLYIIAQKEGYWGSKGPIDDDNLNGPTHYGGLPLNKEPQLKLTTPESAYSGIVEGTLELEGEAWDDESKISAIYYRIDNDEGHEADLTSPTGDDIIYKWTIKWDSRTVPTGIHTIKIMASETWGNSTPLELTVDVLNPIGETDDDKDGLTYAEEITYGTNPENADTDGDGLNDGIELDNSDGNTTDPLLSDTDSDGLKDGSEDRNKNGQVEPTETDPNNPDSDGDLTDDGEDEFPLDPTRAKGADKAQDRFYQLFAFAIIIIIVILVGIIIWILIKTKRIGSEEKNQVSPKKRLEKGKKK
jgi:hypothetical protein